MSCLIGKLAETALEKTWHLELAGEDLSPDAAVH